MRSLAVATLVLLCLLAIPAVGVAVPGAAALDDPAAPHALSTASQSPTDASNSLASASNDSTEHRFTQTIEIDLQPNGDARFIVVQRIPLDGDDEREAFRRLADEFERGQHDIGGETIAANVDAVAAETGREMRIRDRTRHGAIEDETGVLQHEFTWTAFAATNDDRLELGDAFYRDGALWIESLAANQRLIIHTPEEYSVESASQPLTDKALVWEGPRTFDTGDIEASYERDGSLLGQFSGSLLPVGGIVIAGVLILVGWLFAARRDGLPDDVTLPIGTTAGPNDGTAESSTEADRGAHEIDAPAPTDGASDVDESEDDDATELDPELLSDEERVERMLERNGGRMKQANIVKETGWSNAKVSQLLSEMDENDRIDKLRIGRENLISLPDEEVADLE